MRVSVASANRTNPLGTFIRRMLVVEHSATPRTDEAQSDTPVHVIAREPDDVSLYGADAPWIEG